jgi:hypothetical protein
MIQLNPDTTDFSKLSRQQLQQYISSLVQQYSADSGLEYLTAWRQAKSLWPKPFAALDALPQEPQNVADIMSPAALRSIPQLGEDGLGLYAACDMDEAAAVWKACGNNYDPANAEKGWNALQDMIMSKRNFTAQQAESDLRTRFKALSALRDYVLIEGHHNALNVRGAMLRTHDKHGFPDKGWYLENSVFAAHNVKILTSKGALGWRETVAGLAAYNLQIRYTKPRNPRSKPIEQTIGSFAARMSHLPGACGSNERLEKNERLHTFLNLVKSGNRLSPAITQPPQRQPAPVAVKRGRTPVPALESNPRQTTPSPAPASPLEMPERETTPATMAATV